MPVPAIHTDTIFAQKIQTAYIKKMCVNWICTNWHQLMHWPLASLAMTSAYDDFGIPSKEYIPIVRQILCIDESLISLSSS